MGNTQQSKASLFYIVPYICKDKVALETCLHALKHAQEHIEEYPSTAQDSGTSQRTTQHLFTRVLNQIYSHVEVSDTQVALSLLNMGSEVTSNTYTYFGCDNSVNFLDYELQLNQKGIKLSPFLSITDEGEYEETSYEISQQKRFGSAPLYTVTIEKDESDETQDDEDWNKRKIPVHFCMHYRWRGESLKDMSRVEYHALIGIKPIASLKEGGEAEKKGVTGRKKVQHSVLQRNIRFIKHIINISSQSNLQLYTQDSNQHFLEKCHPIQKVQMKQYWNSTKTN
jgi:hypothetical protein